MNSLFLSLIKIPQIINAQPIFISKERNMPETSKYSIPIGLPNSISPKNYRQILAKRFNSRQQPCSATHSISFLSSSFAYYGKESAKKALLNKKKNQF